MKNLFNLLLISTFAASCVNLGGQLNVQQDMAVQKKGGFLNLSTKSAILSPGSYSADLKIKSDKNLLVKVKLNNSDKEILIPIKTKNSMNLKSATSFNLTSDEISQPFDLNGTIKTETSESGTERSEQACSASRYENRCENICTTGSVVRNGRREERRRTGTNCQLICSDISIVYSGYQTVESHVKFTKRVLNVAFTDVNNRSELATLKASGTEAQRVIDYIGTCR